MSIEIVKIPISKVRRFDKQPRTYFDQKSIKDLAISIANSGQQVPIKVHLDLPHDDRYVIVDGERRWRAHKVLQELTGEEPTILAMVEPIQDSVKHFENSVVSNMLREDMHPLDTAAAFATLKDRGYTIKQIAEISSKSQVFVINYLKMNKLPEAVKEMMNPERPKKSRLKITVAIEIANSTKDPDLQMEIAQAAVARQLSVSETRFFISNTYNAHRIANRDTGNQDNPYGYSSVMRISGKNVDPTEQYSKFTKMLGRVAHDVDTAVKTIDLEILMSFRDDVSGDCRVLSRKILETMLNLQRMRDKLNAISG